MTVWYHVPVWRVENGCYCVPQCGGWEIDSWSQTDGKLGISRYHAVSFASKEALVEYMNQNGIPVAAHGDWL